MGGRKHVGNAQQWETVVASQERGLHVSQLFRWSMVDRQAGRSWGIRRSKSTRGDFASFDRMEGTITLVQSSAFCRSDF